MSSGRKNKLHKYWSIYFLHLPVFINIIKLLYGKQFSNKLANHSIRYMSVWEPLMSFWIPASSKPPSNVTYKFFFPLNWRFEWTSLVRMSRHLWTYSWYRAHPCNLKCWWNLVFKKQVFSLDMYTCTVFFSMLCRISFPYNRYFALFLKLNAVSF